AATGIGDPGVGPTVVALAEGAVQSRLPSIQAQVLLPTTGRQRQFLEGPLLLRVPLPVLLVDLVEGIARSDPRRIDDRPQRLLVQAAQRSLDGSRFTGRCDREPHLLRTGDALGVDRFRLTLAPVLVPWPARTHARDDRILGRLIGKSETQHLALVSKPGLQQVQCPLGSAQPTGLVLAVTGGGRLRRLAGGCGEFARERVARRPVVT